VEWKCALTGALLTTHNRNSNFRSSPTGCYPADVGINNSGDASS
jgi:hypothetical protein